MTEPTTTTDAGDLPLCNLCGQTRTLGQLYSEGAPTDLYGLRTRVDGGYLSLALQDCTAYKFALCEFCLDWLFTQCKHPPLVCSVNGLTGADEGLPPEPFVPAAHRLRTASYEERERYLREAARRDDERGSIPREAPLDQALGLLRSVLVEREAMLENLTDTQERCNELQRWVRQLDRHAHVSAFCRMAGQAMRATPGSIAEADLRLALSLVVEECGELIEACFVDHDEWLRAAITQLQFFIKEDAIRVDLPAAVDATIDLDYVVEGLRCRLGVIGDPIWVAVHEANMKKRDGPKDPVTGKQLKPPDWKPPDVHGLLVAQGWKPET
jgi:predicted HAD superfamily Cof-like phosphohydrolase